MIKTKKSLPKVVTVDDRPALRKKLRLAAESDWEAALDDIIKKFLSLFQGQSKNLRIAPFKVTGLEQKRRLPLRGAYDSPRSIICCATSGKGNIGVTFRVLRARCKS
jgi:hypothetical protein